jgi:hypothetical protein
MQLENVLEIKNDLLSIKLADQNTQDIFGCSRHGKRSTIGRDPIRQRQIVEYYPDPSPVVSLEG